ncbi:MAG: hypothetical protein ACJ79A_14530 [Gemmatimonadaceae bacterium]
MHRITRVALASSTLLLVAACAKKEQPANDTAAAMSPAPAPAPAPTLALADVAGRWQFASTPASGKDTSSTKWVLTATPDTTGWTMTFPDKQVVPLQVSVAGDSIMLASAEFSSQRRKGTKVKTESTIRLAGGKLSGMTNAHYVTKGADSTLMLKTEGTRMP